MTCHHLCVSFVLLFPHNHFFVSAVPTTVSRMTSPLSSLSVTHLWDINQEEADYLATELRGIGMFKNVKEAKEHLRRYVEAGKNMEEMQEMISIWYHGEYLEKGAVVSAVTWRRLVLFDVLILHLHVKKSYRRMGLATLMVAEIGKDQEEFIGEYLAEMDPEAHQDYSLLCVSEFDEFWESLDFVPLALNEKEMKRVLDEVQAFGMDSCIMPWSVPLMMQSPKKRVTAPIQTDCESDSD